MKKKRSMKTTVSVQGEADNKNPSQQPLRVSSVNDIKNVSVPTDSLVNDLLMANRALTNTPVAVSDGVNKETTES